MSETLLDVPPAGPVMRLSRALRIGFGVANLIAAGLVAFCVFGILPSRYWPVDSLAAVVAGALAVSAVGLLKRTAWAPVATRIASAIVLALGLGLVAMLFITASYLIGIYDQVGFGGAVIMALVAALALPYLVILPAAQLAWVGIGVGRRGSS